MAHCPRCKGVMGQTDTICPNCGFDFPEPEKPRKGLAYSGLANFALLAGQFMAGIGCVIAIVGCIIAAVNGEWGYAILGGPIAATLLLAMLVVFARVLDRT